MKLAKKTIACVLALALVAVFGCVAFAAGAPTLTVSTSPKEVVAGETVTVTVSATGFAGAESMDLVLGYNPDVVEFVSVDDTVDQIFDMPATGCPEAGQVTDSAMCKKSAVNDASDLFVVTFKCLKAGDMGLTLSVESFSANGKDASVTVKNAVAEVVSEKTAVENGDATTKKNVTPVTGEASIAIVAGVMAVAAVAFVATRKKDAE